MSRFLVLLRHDLTALRREPVALVTLLFTPALLMLFTRPLYATALPRLGYGDGDSNGAELAVPGLTVMFTFFTVGIIIESVFREHGLHTWDRLRASPLRRWELVLGKVAPGIALVVLQTVVLFTLGVALLGLRIRGDVTALLAVALALALCVGTFALALCAVARSRRQAFAVERLVTLTWTVFGGALVPAELLSDWVAWAGRFTPVHWAVTGMRAVVLEGGGWSAVLPAVAALSTFSAVFAAIAVRRFDVARDREHWL